MSNDKKVIIFNAPPNAGKDVAASYIVDVLKRNGIKAQHKEVKENLFKATKSCFGVSDEVWEELYQRDNKELPSHYLVNNGKHISPRQAMINTSEEVLKPLFGKDVFGIMAVKSLGEGVNVFSDGGFPEEVNKLREEVSDSNLLLIHVKRNGCSFDNDSRNYIQGMPNTVVIENEGTIGDYQKACLKVVEKFLGDIFTYEKE